MAMTPNTENIRKWVDALRSGDYQPTVGQLRDEDEYCCLGVATDVAIANGVPMEWKCSGTQVNSGEYPPNKIAYYTGAALPPPVEEWLGVERDNPKVTDADGDSWSLSAANDVGHWSFDEIADAIERKYL